MSKGRGTKKDQNTINAQTLSGNDRGEAKGQTSWWERESSATKLGKSESEEHIVGAPKRVKLVPLEIWETQTVDIDRGSISVDAEGRPMKMYDRNGGNSLVSKTTVTVKATPSRSSHER
jgi:hypothetical protein